MYPEEKNLKFKGDFRDGEHKRQPLSGDSDDSRNRRIRLRQGAVRMFAKHMNDIF